MAERFNRTIEEKTTSFANDAGLPKSFWGEGVNMAVYLISRTPSKTLRDKTPEEMWTGKPVDISHLKIFASKVMVHVLDSTVDSDNGSIIESETSVNNTVENDNDIERASIVNTD